MASSFDALLGKLSSLLGDDQPEAAPQARNALASKVGFRASMLPIGNYDDGSIAFPVWPQSAVDAGNALMRFHRGEAPRPEDAVLAGLAVAGGGLGHLGLRGSARAVSGKALEGVEASRPLTSSPVEAGSVPVTARVYRGAAKEEEWPPGPGTRQGPFWASDNPEVANHYSGAAYADDPGVRAPSITPADITFQNPMVVEAMGMDWNMLPGYATTEFAAREALKKGHDGLVVRNVADDGQVATTYAALRPGTVRSATTGETLFSNPKEAAPAGLLATSSLDRMAADDAIKPRPFPDAPQTYPELEDFVRTNRGGYSSSRADQAWREDPYRYDAYGRGLHDVLNPESMWFAEGPTLQSGGYGAGVSLGANEEDMRRARMADILRQLY
jgi:hypothetical protein